ncbi:coenzyme A disulfide reductase [bacterium BMS3Bbin04]|nr:coenzyme A disulfide reductase [bacterium BMS3Bbin04]
MVKVFDLNAASTGMSASMARKNGIDIEEYWGTFPDRAHYYPEYQNVAMKVVRERGGRLLGMQAVGKGEVVRWVDAFAQILDLAEGDPQALFRFEHAYAPPYATAMDPLHHFAAMIELGDGWQIAPTMMQSGGEAGWTWINMLANNEQDGFTVPESMRGTVIQMNMSQLREKVMELPKENVITFCVRGPRSYEACRFLRSQGIHARYMAGGIAFTH